MRFKAKLEIPIGQSYEEIVEIDNSLIDEWEREGLLDFRLEEYIDNWAKNTVDFTWEEYEDE
jgi:hypothetical protein